MKAPIKWVGSKGRAGILANLAAHFPEHVGTYVEPFFGAGALYFELAARETRPFVEAILTDGNPHLMHMWLDLRGNPSATVYFLEGYAARDGEAFYYAVRKKFNLGPDAFPEPGAFAAAFIYLNRSTYNGLFRVNSEGKFNAAFGHKQKLGTNIVDPPVIECYAALLEGACVECADFSEAFSCVGKGDFMYIDPPFHGTYSGYTFPEFTEEDHVRLRGHVADASARGVKIMVSNADTEYIRGLYDGFRILRTERSNVINANHRDRGSKVDLLILNY